MAPKEPPVPPNDFAAITLSKSTPFDRANDFLEYARSVPDYNHHDGVLLDCLTLRSAEINPTDPKRASTIFDLNCKAELCNKTGNLHGGAVALIFDMCTSFTVAPVAKKGFWDTGNVTRTLNCTYLRPLAIGSKATVESEIVHLGAKNGMIRGVIKNEKGQICYTCEHGKVTVNFSTGKYAKM